MLKISPLINRIISLALISVIYACNNPQPSLTTRQSPGAYHSEIERQIAAGKALESQNNDSLLIVSKALYHLDSLSHDSTALVYAELYETDYYWQAAKHEKAMQAGIKCLANAEKFGIKQALPQIYGAIANLHKETDNYPMAFKNAQMGLDAAISNKDTAAMIAMIGMQAMFTRGLSLNHLDPEINDKKSIELNLAALQMAESSPKYERLRTRFYDNISQYYKDKKGFVKAFDYGNKGVENALKFNQQRSLTYSYCWLGEAWYYTGQHEKGIDYLNKAIQISYDLKEPYRVMEITGTVADCYSSSQNYKEALHYNIRYRTLRDSLKVLDNTRQISELQVKYETSEKDKKINGLKARDQLESLQLTAGIVVLILLTIVIILLYLRGKKEKTLLQKEKLLLDEELKNSGLELMFFTESLRQKNEIIEEFRAEVENLQLQHITEANKESLENLVKAHIMTDETWDNFRKLFTKVHSDFFSRLRQKFPQITATDMRILALIKLQLSNSEMANMLGITIEGVKKSKQRLRKKLDLGKDESMEAIIQSF